MLAQTTNLKAIVPWLWRCFWSAVVMALVLVGTAALFGLFF